MANMYKVRMARNSENRFRFQGAMTRAYRASGVRDAAKAVNANAYGRAAFATDLRMARRQAKAGDYALVLQEKFGGRGTLSKPYVAGVRQFLKHQRTMHRNVGSFVHKKGAWKKGPGGRFVGSGG